MIDSRKASDLCLVTLSKWLIVEDEMKKVGIPVGIVSTFRDFEMQDHLYGQGRTRPGKIVTHVRSGGSFHNVRRAIDAWPLDAEGKLNTKFVDSREAYHLFMELGRIGKQVGFQWGGDWKSPKTDLPHLQDGFCKACNMVFTSARHFNEDGSCAVKHAF